MLCFQTDSNPGTKTLQADLYDAPLPCSRKWCLTPIASKVSICDSHESAFQDLLQVDFTEYWNTCSKALESQKALRIRSILQKNSRFHELLHDVFTDGDELHTSRQQFSTFHAGGTMRFCLYQLHRTVGQELCTLLATPPTRMKQEETQLIQALTGIDRWSGLRMVIGMVIGMTMNA